LADRIENRPAQERPVPASCGGSVHQVHHGCWTGQRPSGVVPTFGTPIASIPSCIGRRRIGEPLADGSAVQPRSRQSPEWPPARIEKPSRPPDAVPHRSSKSSTRAPAGPTLRRSDNSSRLARAPSATTCTAPSDPLATQPRSPRRSAWPYTKYRNPTPWTRPRTTASSRTGPVDPETGPSVLGTGSSGGVTGEERYLR